MTISGPKVRDYTDARRIIDLEIAHGDGFETVLSVFAFAAWSHGGEDAEYEVGEQWFSDVAGRIDPALAATVSGLGCCAWVWLGLLGVVLDLPEPRTAEALVGHLHSTDPVELRRRLLGAVLGHADRELVDRAAAGDSEALAEAVRSSHEDVTGVEWLVETDASEVRRVIADVVATFAEAAHPDRERIAAVLARDADHKRALARTMPPERLVEIATNGVTFAARPEVAKIVLVPSVVMRPWVTISEHGATRIFSYPVADEHLSADPDAPPTWLVGFFKALADERRLRLLSVLAEGPAGLADLTARVDLAKSTVHHHLRVLRTAGLVRITVGDDKEYSLRTDAVPEAARMLESYLGTNTKGVHS